MSPLLLSLGRELTLLAASLGAEPIHPADVIQQTYRFGDHVVTVTPRSAEPQLAPVVADVPEPALRVTPAKFTQVGAPPLPEDTSDLPMPPAPAPQTQTAEPAACPDVLVSPLERVRSYHEVYDAIPFSRAEYDANPSFRHDATMEFLFGQMRPMVIHRNQTRVQVDLPAVSTPPWAYNPYGMNSLYYPFYNYGYRVYRGR